MKKFFKQTFSFALIFFSFFACKEGEFLNQNRELELAEYKSNIRGFIPYYRVNIAGNARPFDCGDTYDGDNRGFSSEDYATSKLNQEIIFDLDREKVLLNSSAGIATKYDNRNVYQDERRGNSIEYFTDSPNIVTSGNTTTATFATYVKSSNPLEDISPNIEINSDFTIIENKEDRYLRLKGTIKADKFPSVEAYIKDPRGTAVFIGVNPCEGGPISIWNPFKREIKFNFKIITDSNGYFQEVEDEYGSTKSIYSWNRDFETKTAYNQS